MRSSPMGSCVSSSWSMPPHAQLSHTTSKFRATQGTGHHRLLSGARFSVLRNRYRCHYRYGIIYVDILALEYELPVLACGTVARQCRSHMERRGGVWFAKMCSETSTRGSKPSAPSCRWISTHSR